MLLSRIVPNLKRFEIYPSGIHLKTSMSQHDISNIYKFAWAQLNNQLQIIRTTPNFNELLGVQTQLLYLPLTDVIDEFVGSESALQDVLDGKLPHFHIDNVNRGERDGRARYFRFTVTRYNPEQPADGLLLGIEDVTQTGLIEQQLTQERNELRLLQRELFRMNSQLQYIAATDMLTGLANRRHFDEELDRELSRGLRFGRTTALLFIDIDNFKNYNDQFGHLMGDEVLRHLGMVLKKYTRRIDTACRFGGEEFAIILPETSAAGALKIADRLRQRIAVEPIHSVYLNKTPPLVTVSIGVAIAPEHATTPIALVRSADVALYAAKKRGKNQVVVYERAIE